MSKRSNVSKEKKNDGATRTKDDLQKQGEIQGNNLKEDMGKEEG